MLPEVAGKGQFSALTVFLVPSILSTNGPEGDIEQMTVAHLTAGSQGAYSLAEGQLVSGVTGVTLVRSDGVDVVASTGSGWFVAWWPGSAGVTSARSPRRAASPRSPWTPHCSLGSRPPGAGRAARSSSSRSSACPRAGPSSSKRRPWPRGCARWSGPPRARERPSAASSVSTSTPRPPESSWARRMARDARPATVRGAEHDDYRYLLTNSGSAPRSAVCSSGSAGRPVVGGPGRQAAGVGG